MRHPGKRCSWKLRKVYFYASAGQEVNWYIEIFLHIQTEKVNLGEAKTNPSILILTVIKNCCPNSVRININRQRFDSLSFSIDGEAIWGWCHLHFFQLNRIKISGGGLFSRKLGIFFANKAKIVVNFISSRQRRLHRAARFVFNRSKHFSTACILVLIQSKMNCFWHKIPMNSKSLLINEFLKMQCQKTSSILPSWSLRH